MRLSRRLTAALGAVSIALPMAAHAQVTVTGVSTGCLYVTVACTPGNSSTLGQLTYTGGNTFTGKTNSAGTVFFGGTDRNFGSFTLTGPGTSYDGDHFILNLAFSQPGSGNTVFNAMLTGELVTTSDNGVGYKFDGPGGDGKANVTTSDGSNLAVTVYHNAVYTTGVQYIGGEVTVSPEPSSMALLGTGLVGLVPMFRRKKQA